jgi:hypothetical protein
MPDVNAAGRIAKGKGSSLFPVGSRLRLRREIVAIDGKALRRALDAGESPKVIVSAWAASNGLVLGQQKVSDKSNEPTVGR